MADHQKTSDDRATERTRRVIIEEILIKIERRVQIREKNMTGICFLSINPQYLHISKRWQCLTLST